MRRWKNDTLSVASHHATKLKEIKEILDFSEEQDTYKFCFAYALRRGLSPDLSSTLSRTTKWAMGNFDKEGDLWSILEALHPEEEDPQKLLTLLSEAGIDEIHEKLMNDKLDRISDFAL